MLPSEYIIKISYRSKNPTNAAMLLDILESIFGSVSLSKPWCCECLQAALATLFE
jgi:hypothetical protein